MSKAILVVDMPSRCLNCNCVGTINRNGKFNVCRILGDILKEDDYYKNRPDWCPLKELPQKKELKGDVTDIVKIGEELVNVGYNACIDEILKGSAEHG